MIFAVAFQMQLSTRPFPDFLSIWGLTPKVKLDSLHRGEQFDASLRRAAMEHTAARRFRAGPSRPGFFFAGGGPVSSFRASDCFLFADDSPRTVRWTGDGKCRSSFQAQNPSSARTICHQDWRQTLILVLPATWDRVSRLPAPALPECWLRIRNRKSRRR